MRDTRAQLAYTIQIVLSNLTELVAERTRLIQHISELAESDDTVLHWTQTSGGARAAAHFTFSPTSPVPEEAPPSRLSAGPQRHHAAPSYQAVPPHIPPMTRLNPSPASRQLMEALEAGQAEHALPRQTSGNLQDGQRRGRQRGQQRPMEVFNWQHQLSFELLVALNGAQVLAQHLASHTHNQFSEQVSSLSRRRQSGRLWLQHSLQSDLVNSVRPLLRRDISRLIADTLPVAASAA